jgi:hypothetical protein
MLTNLKACSVEAARTQAEYLRATPVSGLADLLDRQWLTLFAAEIESLEALGKLKTEFGPIGRLQPVATTGEKKFTVSELVPALRANPDVDDGGLLQRIERIIELEEMGAIEYNTTILDDGSELVIKDGNKRTIAYFERFRSRSTVEVLRVFVLRPKSSR